MNPRTPYQAKFSIAFVVATALLDGTVALESFAPENFDDRGVVRRDVAELLGKTRVTVAPDLTAKYPAAWPTRLRIVLTDGAVLSAGSDYPAGNPENPVSTEQLETKFSKLISPRWGDATAARALEVIRSLESVDDMAEALRDLAPVPAFA
jgi:2-methylcitrate dehydratase PrpD